MKIEEVALGGNTFKSKGVCHLWLINNGSCTKHLHVTSELLAVCLRGQKRVFWAGHGGIYQKSQQSEDDLTHEHLEFESSVAYTG